MRPGLVNDFLFTDLNNDGINDFFTIYGDKAAVEIVSLKIFDFKYVCTIQNWATPL